MKQFGEEMAETMNCDPDAHFEANMDKYFAFQGLINEYNFTYQELLTFNTNITRGNTELGTPAYMEHIIFTPTYLIENEIDVDEVDVLRNFTIQHWYQDYSVADEYC